MASLRVMKFLPSGLMLLMSICLVGCTSEHAMAPVVTIAQASRSVSGRYRVKSGDTVYSVAWSVGMDYRYLAELNHLRPPFTLQIGQMLRLQPQIALEQPAATRPETTFRPARRSHRVEKRSRVEHSSRKSKVIWRSEPVRHWHWPIKGRIVDTFTARLGGNPGINIAGRWGASIRASAAGKVVYSGSGVRGYGNLIIIKHNDNYLSAYAYNRKNLVRLGQVVRVGQVIAQMGRMNSGRVCLHFEIRKNGRPVNPLRYLR